MKKIIKPESANDAIINYSNLYDLNQIPKRVKLILEKKKTKNKKS